MSVKIEISNEGSHFVSNVHNGQVDMQLDLPMAAGAPYSGYSPIDLLLSSIAYCKLATVRFIAMKNQWKLEKITAQLEMKEDMTGDLPETSVSMKMQIQGELKEEQKTQLLAAANHCHVHQLLEGNWKIEDIQLESEVLS